MTKNDLKFLAEMLAMQADILKQQGNWQEARAASSKARQLGRLAGATS
jgi:hypothetical protein